MRLLAPTGLVYTIGIRRKAFPIYKKYSVVSHVVNEDGGLVLTGADGSVIVIPRILDREYKLFPDRLEADRNRKKLKDEQNATDPSRGILQQQPVRESK